VPCAGGKADIRFQQKPYSDPMRVSIPEQRLRMTVVTWGDLLSRSRPGSLWTHTVPDRPQALDDAWTQEDYAAWLRLSLWVMAL